MLKSCFVTQKAIGHGARTWCRWFQMRKNLLSDFKAGAVEFKTTSAGQGKQTEEKILSSHIPSEAEQRKPNARESGNTSYGIKTPPRRLFKHKEQNSVDRKNLRYSKGTSENWSQQQSGETNDRQTSYYKNQSYRDRQAADRDNRAGNRKPFGGQQSLEQCKQHSSGFRSQRKPYKERVLTADEQREEEEFRKYFVEETDDRDRFGDYNAGSETVKKLKHDQTDVKQRRRNWSQTFGTLNIEDDPSLEDVLFGKEPVKRTAADRIPADEKFEDDDDGFVERPHIPLSRKNRKHIPHWYARRIEKLGKKGMVKEALDLFEKQMIVKDRVKPTYYEFGLMITLLGRAGYVQKAFNLFYQMQQLDLVMEPKVFTSLFNACAKSPIKRYGLERAHKLRYLMIEQGIEPTLITYQAMISAFGRCGDTEMAFSLIDEVLQKHKPDTNLLCSALVACISDIEAGFRHAVLVWRKLVQRGVKPDLASYNLLLRAIKECGVGPLIAENNLLLIETGNQEEDNRHDKKNYERKIVSSLQMKVDPENLDSMSVVEVIEGVEPSHGGNTAPYDLISSENIAEKHVDRRKIDIDKNVMGADKALGNDTQKHWWEYDLQKFTDTKSEALVKTNVKKDIADILPLDADMMPNILNPFDMSLQVVSLGRIETKEKRLALCAGMKGYLSNMEREGIKPDLVTFIQLVSVVPESEENEVLDMMALYDVKPDIDFFNHLIIKKAYRGENHGALAVRELIEKFGLVPNIQTYGCWAKACQDRSAGENLLREMAEANLQPNTTIMYCLIRASGYNFPYKSWLLHQMKLLGVPADTQLIKIVEKTINVAKRIIVEKEKGEVDIPFSNVKNFESKFWRFLEFYDRWIKDIEFEKEEHPWAQFRDKPEKTDEQEERGSFG